MKDETGYGDQNCLFFIVHSSLWKFDKTAVHHMAT